MQPPSPAKTRDQLLFAAFVNLPQAIGDYQLRRMSPQSFTLLEAIDSPLLGRGDTSKTLQGVSEYIWIHSADIEEVIQVESRDQLPEKEIRRIGFAIDIEQAYSFILALTDALLRVSAAIAEPEETEGGKPAEEEPAPIGSQASSLPADAPETLPANVTSFGTPPSSAPSSISTPPTSPPEQPCNGPTTSPVIQTLPALPPASPASAQPT
jgi:hypothetical protein